jgi:hypothetical protein
LGESITCTQIKLCNSEEEANDWLHVRAPLVSIKDVKITSKELIMIIYEIKKSNDYAAGLPY